MPDRSSLLARAIACCLLAAPLRATGAGASQEAYWLLDEVRTVAFNLSRARSGKVAAWPRMTVRAGSAALPAPPARGEIQLDHKLEEPAWQAATRFPVGPVFADWRGGPFVMQVRVCRSGKAIYAAIESPRNLAGLGSIRPAGELFAIDGRPVRLPRGFTGQTAEFRLPLARPNGQHTLTFPCEMVRRRNGQLPPGLQALGVHKHFTHPRIRYRKSALWLDDFAVMLAPASAGAQLALDFSNRKLTVTAQGKTFAEALPRGEGVLPFRWAEGKFRFEGFAYVEPVNAMLGSIRRIGAQAPAALDSDTESRRERYCRLRELRARARRASLDAPLLIVKRHPFFAGHIYDDYYRFYPGGGIYVIVNPAAPLAEHRLRPVIDAATKETLGQAVYRDPELSWDAARVVFACKRSAPGTTSIYEIGVDGRGLRPLTSSDRYHDITPAYLPDGRIVCTSTRPRGRVPCFNSGVDTLHVMNPDGTGLRSISSNNVNEFDPAVLPDGRILYGRWEYVDKTALYMQSLWTVLPDGTHETALFGNNLARPTAILDARPVPNSLLVAATLTPHNGQAVGAIGLIDPRRGKDSLDAITNFTPEYPAAMDQGLHCGPCDPWPLNEDSILISNNAIGGHGIIELIDRFGGRELVHADPAISCFAPMLVKPRQRPERVALMEQSQATSRQEAQSEMGRFLVLDVYQGLTGVPRGTVKQLRVIEETARVSEVPPGGRWWNQAFLTSWQGSYVVKNFLGVVPVREDGSAFFLAPPGRALYFEALDADGREVQRMRTFVQAVPGVTRSCAGCHEPKLAAPATRAMPLALRRPPARPQPESWGSGFVDYPTMIQPILDRRCVSCHGGEKGIAAGIDLSGGWTWAFNISYETLLKHDLAGFLRCHNSDVSSSKILPPRTIGSGAARLGGLLTSGHGGRLPGLTRGERALVMAWMDGNSNYYGTWDYTKTATCEAILEAAGPLAQAMARAGCTRCHAASHIGSDWLNLARPEWSRILRAPLKPEEGGLGLGWCRNRKAQKGLPLVTQRVLPPDRFHPLALPKRDPAGKPHVTFQSPSDPRYQAMLRIIEDARAAALARPRVDMPGADIIPGVCRMQESPAIPSRGITLLAAFTRDNGVALSWTRNAATIGLEFELHRSSDAGFEPGKDTLVTETPGFRFTDYACPAGLQHYALVARASDQREVVARASLNAPQPAPPPKPTDLAASTRPGAVILRWRAPAGARWQFHVFRTPAGETDYARLTQEPIAAASFTDYSAQPETRYAYALRTVDRRGLLSALSESIEAAAEPLIREPVFAAEFETGPNGQLYPKGILPGRLRRGAKVATGALDLGRGGYAEFPHRPEFDLGRGLTLEVWVRVDAPAKMPVIAACGAWRRQGWFLQYFNHVWRWHVAGVDCDGGRPAPKKLFHLVGTFDGQRARLFINGRLAATRTGAFDLAPWRGPLLIGQYSTVRPEYQVVGVVPRVRLYGRPVEAAEAAAWFKAGPAR